MPERIHIMPDPDRPAVHFMIEAFASYNKKYPKNPIPAEPKGFLDIEFKINGREICFEDSIKEIYARFEKQVDKEAAKKALEMYSLNDLQDKITTFTDQYTYEMKAMIAKQLGKSTHELFEED